MVTTLEVDLHYTADHKVVVWHDNKILSSKCSPSSDLRLSQMTLLELKQFSCLHNVDDDRFPFQNNDKTEIAGDNYQIQTLDELFLFVKAYTNSTKKSEAQRENARGINFNLEVKRTPNFPENINDGFDGVNPGAFEHAILKSIQEHNLEHRVIIQSFDHRSLWAIRSINNSIRLSVLTLLDTTEPASYSRSGANIWSPYFQDLSVALINKAHNANLKVIPWTINDSETMKKVIKMGVDGIISDRPDLLLLSINN